MMKTISTKSGIYEYTPIELYYGRKVISIPHAKENLLIFRRVMNQENIDFGLIYGTLLGAVREKNFIVYDEDTDVFMLDEYRESFFNALFVLREHGFVVARYESSLLSLMRNNDYIDIYFFKKSIFKDRVSNALIVKSHFLENTEELNFLGEIFQVPKDYKKFLRVTYGVDWMVPKKNAHAEPNSIKAKMKRLIKKSLPKFLIVVIQNTLRKRRSENEK